MRKLLCEVSHGSFVFICKNCAGSPYYIKADGRIYYYEPCDGEERLVAESLEEFFR